MGVSIDEAGRASGSFECLMAGRSAFALADFGLEHIRAVYATPTIGSVNGQLKGLAGGRLEVVTGGQVNVHA
jgi:hypothetical protein